MNAKYNNKLIWLLFFLYSELNSVLQFVRPQQTFFVTAFILEMSFFENILMNKLFYISGVIEKLGRICRIFNKE